MGFRSYIRHFLVAILMLFRPSGPCCLSVAEAPFLSLERSSSRRKSVAKIILFHFLGAAFPSFTAMVFSHPGSFEQKEQQEQEQQQQKEKVTKK